MSEAQDGSYRIIRPRPLEDRINAHAQWMAAEVERVGYLEHQTAAREICDKEGIWWGQLVHRENYAEREVRTNRFGHIYRAKARLRIRPEVLKAFKRLTSKTVVWEKDARAWRKRKS